ncbi:hypothetical protein CXF59_06660 [Flavobacterium sp. ALD4]|uniref:hypothetical protein n=1 Tax=Flavobacterium sp. ALD4 TaxID=2058314 RepID=UPI000C32E608|nr:hypothetical protein [Flavobacterium sp. ALD4]PKH67586.1 hypothetical protein CXF59_06660 [Flavobacterium sp. ALD4]
MRKQILAVLLFISSFGFSQSVDDYKAVIIPIKYEFTSTDNQYRLATISKYNLNNAGFEAFYDNESVTDEYKDRCSLLYYDIVKEKSFLTTKVHITLKDCYGKVIFESETGVSKEKAYELAYPDALNEAFASVNSLNYKYKEKEVKSTVDSIAVDKSAVSDVVSVTKNRITKPETLDLNDSSVLYAQPIVNGFQLVNSLPKVVMKVFKTSSPTCLIAVKESTQGVLISKDNQWFFEYYQNDKLISEKIEVKF